MEASVGSETIGATYARLAGLGLEIERYRTERHELDVSSGFRRVTTEVVLVGGGLEGRGEDVTYAAEDHDDYPAELSLAGEWSLDAFSRHLGGMDLFPGGPPQQESFRDYRRWAFESAALDLALRQARQNLARRSGGRSPPCTSCSAPASTSSLGSPSTRGSSSSSTRRPSGTRT